jgi:hypothetical protein
MITRILLAVVGAILITAGLLFTMDSLTTVFRPDSGERFFRITDILPRLEPDRPIRPPPAERTPETTAPRYAEPEVNVAIEPTDPEAVIPPEFLDRELTSP